MGMTSPDFAGLWTVATGAAQAMVGAGDAAGTFCTLGGATAQPRKTNTNASGTRMRKFLATPGGVKKPGIPLMRFLRK